MANKFISINYRHANNSRHALQVEQFYIDALKAIGIDDISKFVAENAMSLTNNKTPTINITLTTSICFVINLFVTLLY